MIPAFFCFAGRIYAQQSQAEIVAENWSKIRPPASPQWDFDSQSEHNHGLSRRAVPVPRCRHAQIAQSLWVKNKQIPHSRDHRRPALGYSEPRVGVVMSTGGPVCVYLRPPVRLSGSENLTKSPALGHSHPAPGYQEPRVGIKHVDQSHCVPRLAVSDPTGATEWEWKISKLPQTGTVMPTTGSYRSQTGLSQRTPPARLSQGCVKVVPVEAWLGRAKAANPLIFPASRRFTSHSRKNKSHAGHAIPHIRPLPSAAGKKNSNSLVDAALSHSSVTRGCLWSVTVLGNAVVMCWLELNCLSASNNARARWNSTCRYVCLGALDLAGLVGMSHIVCGSQCLSLLALSLCLWSCCTLLNFGFRWKWIGPCLLAIQRSLGCCWTVSNTRDSDSGSVNVMAIHCLSSQNVSLIHLGITVCVDVQSTTAPSLIACGLKHLQNEYKSSKLYVLALWHSWDYWLNRQTVCRIMASLDSSPVCRSSFTWGNDASVVFASL